MRKPVIFMFSGQGSQYYQMGSQLYSEIPRFKYWMDYCDKTFHPFIGDSIVDIIYKRGKKSDTFDRALHTNAALISFQYSLAKILIEQGLEPDMLLGYSLGEFVSAIVSEAMSLEEGAKLLSNYAVILENNIETYGSMLSVLDSPSIIDNYSEYFVDCEVIATNFAKNFVVSGSPNAINQLREKLSSIDVIIQQLPVRHAFHTHLFDRIRPQFYSLGGDISFKQPKYPSISCFTSKEISGYSMDHFWSVTRKPILFKPALENLPESQGYLFLDLGPSGTLATFSKYINSDIEALPVVTPFGKDIETFSIATHALEENNIFIEPILY